MNPITEQPLFYVPQIPRAGETVKLSEEESRHAAAAKRMRVGEEISLFDGRGCLASGRVTALERRQPVEVEILHSETFPQPQPILHLASALPKGDRQSVMLDMATQLGMQRFTPLLTEFSAVKPQEKSVDRLHRICLAACKQSRRLWLPEIEPPADLQSVVEQAARKQAPLWVAHPGMQSEVLDATEDIDEILILVGPEGGFSEKEVSFLADSGGHFVDLGGGILRVETAVVAVLARLGR